MTAPPMTVVTRRGRLVTVCSLQATCGLVRTARGRGLDRGGALHERDVTGGDGDHTASDRWLRTWSHREDLLRIAVRRSVGRHDAEDAVQEAMIRAAERPHLDVRYLGAWMTTVTTRLCVDRHRQLRREDSTTPEHVVAAASVEESVCDRAEGAWVARTVERLPERQAQAIRLFADGHTVGETAMLMGLSYRAVESLLARARRALRAAIATTLSVVAVAIAMGRGWLKAGSASSVVAGTVAASMVLGVGTFLPSDSEVGPASGSLGVVVATSPGKEPPVPAVSTAPAALPLERPAAHTESATVGSVSEAPPRDDTLTSAPFAATPALPAVPATGVPPTPDVPASVPGALTHDRGISNPIVGVLAVPG